FRHGRGGDRCRPRPLSRHGHDVLAARPRLNTGKEATIMAPPTASPLLTEAMLQQFRKRAPVYDRENRFFQEDFDDLRQAGYLAIAGPKELGGRGLTFAECMREQRRLAYHAHATALGMNMHLYWTGVAADLWRAGDKSLEWMLRGAVNGEVFAAGH